jgi:anti-sigma factor ChrR (cupin superfamily)
MDEAPGTQMIDTNRAPWEYFKVSDSPSAVIVPSKTLINDPDTGMIVAKVRYSAGYTTISHWHNCAHGIYILDGILKTHAGDFGPGNFFWFPAGLVMKHGATQENDCTYLFITNKAFDVHFTHEEGGPTPRAASVPEPVEVTVVDTNLIPWEFNKVAASDSATIVASKTCIIDPDSGLLVAKVRYDAGFVTLPHWHNCAHGGYVLDGILTTHLGNLGPGGFFWFPERSIMSHGATPENEVTYLFISNKAFDLQFIHEAGDPPAVA